MDSCILTLVGFRRGMDSVRANGLKKRRGTFEPREWLLQEDVQWSMGDADERLKGHGLLSISMFFFHCLGFALSVVYLGHRNLFSL